MHYSTLLPLAALVPASYAQLNTLAKAKGLLYFGTASDNTDATEWNDAAYKAILSNTSEFGQITPANAQKWQFIEPQQNVFDFTEGDQIVAYAEANGQIMRCHNTIWYSQLATWVSNPAYPWTAENLTAVIQNHVAKEIGHYKGKCYAWDVVNEAFNDDGTYRQDVFLNTLGPEYINIAFAAAALADPAAKLYYNDYNIENVNAKSNSARQMVANLTAAGIRIDGIGLQAHFIVGETPSYASQVQNLQAFHALGVETAYTELDVRNPTIPANCSVPASALATQAQNYADTVNACLATGTGCVGITIWDFTDKYSWVEGTFPGQGQATPWDRLLHKKPAYNAIVTALGGTPQSLPAPIACASSSTMSSSMSMASTTMMTSTVATTMMTSTTPMSMPSMSTPTVTVTVTASGSAAPPAPTVTMTVTAKPSTCVAVTPSSTAPAMPKQTHYGQCGGMGYMGLMNCAAPWTCKFQNPYYSQCL